MDIGKIIREMRCSQGITQERFAEDIGVTVQTVSRWENAVNYPDISLLPSIAGYFRVTTDQLLGLERNDSMAKLIKTTEVFEVENKQAAQELIDKFASETFPKLISHSVIEKDGKVILTVEKEFNADPEKMKF